MTTQNSQLHLQQQSSDSSSPASFSLDPKSDLSHLDSDTIHLVDISPPRSINSIEDWKPNNTSTSLTSENQSDEHAEEATMSSPMSPISSQQGRDSLTKYSSGLGHNHNHLMMGSMSPTTSPEQLRNKKRGLLNPNLDPLGPSSSNGTLKRIKKSDMIPLDPTGLNSLSEANFTVSSSIGGGSSSDGDGDGDGSSNDLLHKVSNRSQQEQPQRRNLLDGPIGGLIGLKSSLKSTSSPSSLIDSAHLLDTPSPSSAMNNLITTSGAGPLLSQSNSSVSKVYVCQRKYCKRKFTKKDEYEKHIALHYGKCCTHMCVCVNGVSVFVSFSPVFTLLLVLVSFSLLCPFSCSIQLSLTPSSSFLFLLFFYLSPPFFIS